MTLSRGVKVLVDIGRSQAVNFRNLVTGRPLTAPSLGSMTLDHDDVVLARTWLRDRSRWKERVVVDHYETDFANWNGSRFAFAFMGGRVALSACIHALGLQPEEEVILPGYTCIVVANAFHFAGVRTIYSDIELDTYGLDVNGVEEKITTRTRAILLQHLYGLVCRDYEAIIDLARRHDLWIIEDCAHSTGATYKGIKVGNFGDVAFYTSEQSKVFNTIQGGIAVTNNNNLAEKLKEYYLQAPVPDEDWIEKQLSNVIMSYYLYKHPKRWLFGDMIEILYGKKRVVSTTKEEENGIKPIHYGQKMPDPIAAIGLNQLGKIDRYNKYRRQAAKYWDEWCDLNGYKKPLIIKNSNPIYLRYPVLVEPEKKADTSWAREKLGVELGVWFTSQLHPVKCDIKACPNAERAVNQCINFPCLME